MRVSDGGGSAGLKHADSSPRGEIPSCFYWRDLDEHHNTPLYNLQEDNHERETRILLRLPEVSVMQDVGRSVCATLSVEATSVWDAMPKKRDCPEGLSRSEKLSRLLIEQDTVHQQILALKQRAGFLMGLLAQCRDYFGVLLAFYPHLDAPRKDRIGAIIADVQDATEGTIYHDYGGRKFHPSRVGLGDSGDQIVAGSGPLPDQDSD